MKNLPDLLRESETRIAHRVITRARERGFGTWTPPLEEAWLESVRALSEALVAAWTRERRPRPALARPRGDDEAALFGAAEARQHRERGLGLPLVLGLLKIFREVVLELAGDDPGGEDPAFLLGFFDAAEVGAAADWSASQSDDRAEELAAAARRLAIEKGRLETLFASIPHPVLLVEPDGFLSGMNHAAEQLFRGPGAAVERAPPWLSRRIARVLSGGAAQASFEEEVETARGRLRLAVSAERMLDVTQRFDGAVVWMEDVTERRRIEARLHSAERLASLGTLSAGVAHEIANPLASVLSGLSHLAGELDDAAPALPRQTAADLVETVADARAAAGRVTRIVRAMQALAGSRGDGLEPALVAPPLRRALALAAERAGAVRLEAAIADLPPVLGREELLEQVFANLVDNALRAAATGGRAGRVAVRAGAKGDEVRIEVADDGPGIPAAVRDRVFDPFFTTREVGSGVGLGLALCHAVVTAFGGTVALVDAPGGGTVARVVLRAAPAARGEERASAAPQAWSQRASRGVAAGMGPP